MRSWFNLKTYFCFRRGVLPYIVGPGDDGGWPQVLKYAVWSQEFVGVDSLGARSYNQLIAH